MREKKEGWREMQIASTIITLTDDGVVGQGQLGRSDPSSEEPAGRESRDNCVRVLRQETSFDLLC